MASPNIKIHLVPTDFDPNNPSLNNGIDVRSITSGSDESQKKCRLIEKATNDRWVVQNTLNPKFLRNNLIRLTQDSSDSTGKTFIIDYVTEKDSYPSNSFFEGCNWVYNSDPIASPSVYTEEEWVMNHHESASQLIDNLYHQIFIKKESDFIGISGVTSENVSIPYTYIPRVGSYSFNFNDYDKDISTQDTQINSLNFIGDIKPVYPEFNSSINEWDWGGPVHYTHTYSSGKNKITFSQQMYDNTIRTHPGSSTDFSVYELYFRGHIYRTDNIHSTSGSGIDQTQDSVYFAIPHDDILEQSSPSIRTLNSSNVQVSTPFNETMWDEGLIKFNYSSYPPSQYNIFLDSYQYHSWMRLTNDMTSDLLFRNYFKDTENHIEIYNSNDPGDVDGSQGQETNTTSGQIQVQQLTVNYTWVDIKITNEALIFESNDLPNLLNLYIDAIPRGDISGAQDEEQIISGQHGLISKDRPWDHQEGARVETDKVCFIRPVKDYFYLYNKPNDLPNTVTKSWNAQLYDNPMFQMNAAQARSIAQWYKNNNSLSSSGNKRFLLLSNDDVVSPEQTGSSINMLSGDEVYARVIHMLNDGSVGTPVASAPKYWSIEINGEYLGGGL